MKRAPTSKELAQPKPANKPAKSTRKARSVPQLTIDAPAFRRRLMAWYRIHARTLPWRGATDPYQTWVSEIMLQQTRVAAVLDHYAEFLRRFPTLVSLALAPEADVLAAWFGLGYYRRARMLHKAAQFIILERNGRIPTTSTELRSLPGIGDYTAAAIASIAFGESIAVVDGNVERVLLRIAGRPNDATAQSKAFIQAQAQALVPPKRLSTADASPATRTRTVWLASERIAIAAAAHPNDDAGAGVPGLASETWVSSGKSPGTPAADSTRLNAAGDHNQAMMELGATVCLPQAPLCLSCPVHDLCLTRGEHPTPTRAPLRSQPAAYLLHLRKVGPITEVLLTRRPAAASLMPNMFELPTLPIDSVQGREPVLRLRHSITNTNYYVQVFAPATDPGSSSPEVQAQIASSSELGLLPPPSEPQSTRASRLPNLPLTGLARKILQRLNIMETPNIALLE